MTPYASNQEDDEKAASWRLASVPAALQKELDDYKLFRTSPLNRSRDGTACIDIVRLAIPPIVPTMLLHSSHLLLANYRPSATTPRPR